MENCKIYKLSRDAYVANTFILIVYVILDIVLIVGVIFFVTDSIIQNMIGCAAIFGILFIYLRSKQILKVKWYKDKFVLCNRLGEKEFSFDKSEVRRIGYNGGIVHLKYKKGRQTFFLFEDDFPEVVHMLTKFYREAEEKSERNENKADFEIYKPKFHQNVKVEIAETGFFFFPCIGLTALKLCTGTTEVSWLTCILFALVGVVVTLLVIYAILDRTREIKWYMDKLLLISLLEERSFSFDKIKLKEVVQEQKGFSKLIFQNLEIDPKENEIETFCIDERNFPEVVEKLKKMYGENKLERTKP